MTTTEFKQRTAGIIDVMPEEFDDFELQVQRFQAGEFDETEFLAYRLKQGVYGQRQPDAQMIRVKIPFGGLKADQLDALGEVSALFGPAEQGARDDAREHPVPPRQAGERGARYARAGRSRTDHEGSVRQHGAQRHRVCDGGSVLG